MKALYRTISTVFGVLFVLANTACSKQSNAGRPALVDTPPSVSVLINLPPEWKKQTALMTGFPAGIEVYRNTTPFSGKAMNAYCVVFDPKSTAIDFKPVLASSNKKPSSFFAEESGTTYACINSGYFGTNASYSLVQYNGVLSSINIKSVNRPFNGISTTYFPTRGAFGLTANGVPEVAWVYHVGAGNGELYKYPIPSANALNTEPKPQPSASYPSGGNKWNINSGVGGSPVLIRNNEINITDTEELIDINNTTSRARSAIGATAEGRVILLAVEGNNATGGAGLNLQEMANLMKSMGCTNALNLDGGGSSSLIVNGQATIKPSDAGGERAVMSVIIIKKK